MKPRLTWCPVTSKKARARASAALARVGSPSMPYVTFGVLFGRSEHLEGMAPPELGGGTVKDVSQTGHVLQDLPWRFEAGTTAISR